MFNHVYCISFSSLYYPLLHHMQRFLSVNVNPFIVCMHLRICDREKSISPTISIDHSRSITCRYKYKHSIIYDPFFTPFWCTAYEDHSRRQYFINISLPSVIHTHAHVRKCSAVLCRVKYK